MYMYFCEIYLHSLPMNHRVKKSEATVYTLPFSAIGPVILQKATFCAQKMQQNYGTFRQHKIFTLIFFR